MIPMFALGISTSWVFGFSSWIGEPFMFGPICLGDCFLETFNWAHLAFLPRGSKDPIVKDSSPKSHTLNVFLGPESLRLQVYK